ncbi:MAG: hypothetical protein IJ576_08750 [Synergistaceae bacterium]|nr:hypothetical protein [Synergistaceae bacterium]MBR1419037.1 hypothetical protein [Synergistaceae bacterium]
MASITVELTPELEQRVVLWGGKGNETPEELTLRLLEEYVDDCEDAERISEEVASGRMETYSIEEVRDELSLARS